MPQSFQTRIEDLVGEAASGDLSLSTNMMQDMFDEGLRAVIRVLPNEALDFAAKKTTFAPTSGTQVKNPRILRVLRSDGTVNRVCNEIDVAHAGDAAEKGSLYEVSAFTPAYYLEPQASGFVTLKILPASATATHGILYHVVIPPIAISNTGMVAGFPEELEGLPVIYAAGLVLLRESGVTRRTSQDQVEAAVTAMGKYASALPALVIPPVPEVQTLVYETAGDTPSSTVTIATSVPTYGGNYSFPVVETEIDDALLKAQTLMDAGASVGGDSAAAAVSFQTNIAAERHEKARTALQGAAQEVSRATARIQAEQTKVQEFINETRAYLQKFQTDVAARNSEVTDQVAEVNAGIAAYTAEERDHLNSFNALAEQYKSDLQRYAGEVAANVQEFQSKLQSAVSYLSEAQARLGAAASYDGKSTLAWDAGKDLIKQFRDEMELYRGGRLDGRQR